MSQRDTILTILTSGTAMLRRHLADFSDAEMLHRPVPTANHPAYQIAHLLRVNGGSLAAFGAAAVPLPAVVGGVKSESAKSDRPEDFPSKEELVSLFEAQVESLKTAVKAMSDADFDKPSPEHFRAFAPTLGALALMMPLHMSMHVGQMQVGRRSLGKPVLF